jgi:ABC-type phosphate transport system substrate-binding protein
MSGRNVVVAALWGLFAVGPLGAQESYKIIVNAANPGAQIKREALQAIFLRPGARWGDGRPVEMVDQSTRSSVRASFCELALGQSLPAVQAQWTQSILQGKGAPPPVRPSDDEVIAFVKSKPAGIGYVSPGASLDPGVKVLRLIE